MEGGSRCQYATYYYISLGVILFVMAITLLLIIIWYIRRRKKLKKRSFRQQIQQLNEVWQIGWEDVTVQEEIGGGASGRVVLAQYRDLPVAVKMLRTHDDPNDSLKFAEEIKFMQTMRHPNIVLFLGAGRTPPKEQPFLVLEFTRRGSLRKVLDDESIELIDRRKIDFAIHAAKGMAFLHNLNPPRIHRDLKGDNLLVSESWVVKVADFGLGRLFSSEKKREHAGRKKQGLFKKRSITEPLLEAREELSLDGIGTARWSAPELSRGEKYDGSIDVYSFGIVLWENWTRDFPFGNYAFGHAVATAVERGERPPVPGNCPANYVNIMKACWDQNPRKRPSFEEIVNRLENVDELMV